MASKLSRGRFSDELGQFVFGGLLYTFQTAERPKQLFDGLFTDSRHLMQFRCQALCIAASAMKGNGKPVGLVADGLNQMQNRRELVKDDGFVLLAVDVDPFLALRYGRQRLESDTDFLECGGS